MTDNRARKTIAISDVKEKANKMLELSTDEKVQGREGIANFLSSLLHDTNNYKGFRYIDGQQGEEDPTRRRYF